MKKRVIFAMFLGAIFVLTLGAYSTLQTYHAPYSVLRAEANEDAAIDLTTAGDFANKPASALQIRASDGGESAVNGIQLTFCGGSAADKTFGYKVYMWRKTNGPAELVCSGVGTLGTQAVVKYPHNKATATNKFWADTLTATDVWITAVGLADEGGNNRVAKISFDMFGYEWIYVEITNADGSTGTEAGSIIVYYSFF